LQEITEKQIQRSIEKGEKKEKCTEQDRELQKKRLELEAKKLSICERELKLEELESAKKQLHMLQSTSEEEVDPEVWTMMKEQKNACSSSYLVFRQCSVVSHAIVLVPKSVSEFLSKFVMLSVFENILNLLEP
jgi:hypothetical protein